MQLIKEDRYRHLVCPSCRKKMDFGGYELICNNCAAIYPVEKGIPCFAHGSSDWKLSSTVDSEAVLKIARDHSWQNSLNTLPKNKADWIKGKGRFPIAYFASPKGRVLDLGCGWGGVSFWMAEEFKYIYALDIKLDGLQFIDIRSTQDDIQNVQSVQGNVFSLPFPDNFFDLIVLNGVLEWIGTFSTEANPLVLHEKGLKEVSRVLKPEGALCTGIENRYGIQYFLGYPEEHTGLRFISLFPRKIGQIYHKLRNNKDYRAITHSKTALKRILKNSGFKHLRFFSVFPSYRNCRYATSMNGHLSFAFIVKNYVMDKFPLPKFLKNLTVRFFSRFALPYNLGSFFSPSWIVLSSKEKPPRFQLNNGNKKIEIDKTNEIAFVINNRRANLIAVNGNSGKIDNKYSVPINSGAKQKIEITKYILNYIIEQQPELIENIPEVKIHNKNKKYIEVTKRVDGKPIDINDIRCLDSFLTLLTSLGKLNFDYSKIQGPLDDIDIRNKLAQLATEQNLSSSLSKYIKAQNLIHGDLNKNNIFIRKSEPLRVTLLDFEHAKLGPSVFNWYDFLIRNLLIYGGKYPLSTANFIKRFQKFPGNVSANSILTQVSIKFLNLSKVPGELHKDLTILYLSYLCQDPIIKDRDFVIKYIKSRHLSL